MEKPTLENCPTCLGRKHVAGTDGFNKRCPDCFVKTNVARVLRKAGYPENWAELEFTKYATAMGKRATLVTSLESLFKKKTRSLHIFGPPTEHRNITFAVVISGLIGSYNGVQVFDTAQLASQHFSKEDRPVLRFSNHPMVLTLGKEIEAKLGSFYARAIIEHAAMFRIPLVLFTDGCREAMSGRYVDFNDLSALAGFTEVEISVPKKDIL